MARRTLHENCLVRPCGLPHRLTRLKLAHHGLQIENRRAVDGVEVRDEELRLGHAHDAAPGSAESVQSVPGALGNDSDARPGRVVARVTRAADDSIVLGPAAAALYESDGPHLIRARTRR